jgi:hypothetical protein
LPFRARTRILQLYRCMASQARVADCINYLQ